ncbi:MAG: hypothetical protein ISR79_02595 [Nitrosopumilus sp.]|nr:hypothetical protein [Nitrosopumilus sp.]
MIRPTLSETTATKLSKVIGFPIEFGLEKSVLILIQKYTELQNEVKQK